MISRPDSHYFPSYLLQCTFIYLQLNDVVTYFRCIQFVIVLFGKKNAVALHEKQSSSFRTLFRMEDAGEKNFQCNAVFFKDAIILIFLFLFAEKNFGWMF